MNYEDQNEINMIFHQPGLQDNAQRITLEIPANLDPEIAKSIFHETFCVTRMESGRTSPRSMGLSQTQHAL